MIISILLALIAAAPADRDARGAWAIGYAAAVERACPGWRRLSQPELARRGLLNRSSTLADSTLADWGPDGALTNRYWQGMERAELDQRSHGRCRPADWPARVRKALEPVPGTTPALRD